MSWLDILLIVLFVGFLVSGLRKGLFVTLGGIAGFVAGGVATFFAIPLVSSWVQDAGWRLFWVVATAVVLMLLGHGIGVAIGARIRLGLNFPVLRSFDRLLGGVANVAVAGLVISAIAFSVATMGVPLLSQQIAGSQVIRTIRDVTPDPVAAVMAQARATVMGQTIPELLEPFAPVDDARAPSPAPSTEALKRAGESVVKITGTAFACGVNQTGSGFAAAPDRVITNAHVVSGITEPVVNTRDGRALPASVVHFDTATDLAVLAVEGLGLDPIPVGEDLAKGDSGAFLGYPAGGPFSIEGATVQSLRTVMVQNIYGADPSPLEIYQLGAEVEQGNSGGPLLGRDGELAGVVFAKAKGDLAVGYALSLDEVEPVVDGAPGYADAVSTGACSAT
ncbi:MAG: MarP family serine protease [Arthrobacter sp.]|uniref:MarP family serine protease n=1 Tax=Arthrobacter sp. TaxID=1667 RepID=UPI00348E0D40